MKFMRKMYIGEGVKRPSAIKYKLRLRRPIPNTYILRLAENTSDYVEIIKGIYFMQPLAYKEKNQIVGFASGESEAYELVTKMMQDCLDETGQVDLRAYLIQRSKK